jgi:AcrR family transcriptional regulator
MVLTVSIFICDDVAVVNIPGDKTLVPLMKKRPQPPRAYHHGDLRRSLIDAAFELLAEEQDWSFSLREVARRARVSHNAPYNHFADKRELLAAVAASGFLTLRDRMRKAIEGVDQPDEALVKTGVVYVRFGIENPAFYKLMFGSVLGSAETDRPQLYVKAADEAKAVLVGIIERGAAGGIFPALQEDRRRVQVAVLAAWSAVHGLTMLAIDGLAGGLSRRALLAAAEQIAQTLVNGLKGSPA